MRLNRPRIKRGTVSIEISRPAPVLGWNAKEAISEMDYRTAVFLDNWWPTPTDVRIRKGCATHVTDLPAPAKTLMAYSSGSTRKLFAAAGAGFYDVTTAGAVGAAVATGFASSEWQHTQFENNAGNHFVMACNGTDPAQIYNGTTWAAASITGVSPSLLRNVVNHKDRLWFAEQGTLNVWYLALSSIAGAANKINIGALAKRGGSVRALFSIPTTAGDTADDYLGVVTDQGELFIFQGTDPAVAGSWALSGSFQVGRPIGWRCAAKWGDDVALLTDQGLISVLSIIHSANGLGKSISDNIRAAVSSVVLSRENTFGWQVLPVTSEKQLILNIPMLTGETGQQYVMNTEHGAWCRFLGWGAYCFEPQDGKLYFGTATGVRLANVGQSDAGTVIEADGSTAYDYYEKRGRNKHFKMIRPTFIGDGAVGVSVTMGADFSAAPVTSSPPLTSGSGSSWDVSDWDVADWGGQPSPTRDWTAAGIDGDCATTRVRVRTTAAEIKWTATDVLLEVGGVL